MYLLDSKYVIDGIPMEMTPAEIIGKAGASSGEVVYDETIDPDPECFAGDPLQLDEYVALVRDEEQALLVPFASEFSVGKVAGVLIDSIWRKGAVRLEDMPVALKWQWNTSSVGNATAFYGAVSAVSDYLDALGAKISSCSVSEGMLGVGGCMQCSGGGASEGVLGVECSTPFTKAKAICGAVAVNRPSSWLVYIPFETSDYNLGGSLLSQCAGFYGGKAPELADPDYFMDCFELVRELVEDGVVIAGVTVSRGGLLKALDTFCCASGADIDLTDLIKAGEHRDAVSVGFAEVPGVIVQIDDSDFDYLDAECLLQDIAYFPLGHPDGSAVLKVGSHSRDKIQNILASLLRG